MTRPLDRIDATMLAALASAAGVDRFARWSYSDPAAAELVARAVRWVDTPVAFFIWEGVPAFLTPTDLMGLAASAVLLIRFAAWAFGPLACLAWRLLLHRGRGRP